MRRMPALVSQPFGYPLVAMSRNPQLDRFVLSRPLFLQASPGHNPSLALDDIRDRCKQVSHSVLSYSDLVIAACRVSLLGVNCLP